MKPLTAKQYQVIEDVFPVQRGNVSVSNLAVLNAILYVAENGCKWRQLPPKFGKWMTVYMRMRRWAENGVLARVLDALLSRLGISLAVTALSLDSTSVKVHPDGTGAPKKRVHKPSVSAVADGIRKST